MRDPTAENSVLLSSTLKLIPSRMRWGRCCCMSARSWPRVCSAFCHLIRYLDNLQKQDVFLLAFKMIRQCTVLKSLAFGFWFELSKLSKMDKDELVKSSSSWRLQYLTFKPFLFLLFTMSEHEFLVYNVLHLPDAS